MISTTLSNPRARESDPITSWIAADQVTFAECHYKKILQALEIGPMGKDGISSFTGLDAVQIARRLPELQRQGLVCLTGKQVKSATGRPEREWQLP